MPHHGRSLARPTLGLCTFPGAAPSLGTRPCLMGEGAPALSHLHGPHCPPHAVRLCLRTSDVPTRWVLDASGGPQASCEDPGSSVRPGRHGSRAALGRGRPACQPHCAVTAPKAGTWHRQPLGSPGTVVMPAVTQAAGQETPGVLGFWDGSKGMYEPSPSTDAWSTLCHPKPATYLHGQPHHHTSGHAAPTPECPSNSSPSRPSGAVFLWPCFSFLWDPGNQLLATRRFLSIFCPAFETPAP